MKKFDLNIQKVLEDWEICHAVREIIANAIDEQMLTNTNEIKVYKENDKWHIRDFGRGIRYTHLTQNECEEKLQYPDKVIGKFGVGLKDAFATFNRNNINVEILSKFGRITLGQSTKKDFEDITTLHAFVEEENCDKNFIGTDFVFSNLQDVDMEKAKNFFLKFSNNSLLETTSFGEVYKKENTAYIYINGLKVAEEENFLFSYNITSINSKIKKSLNRERTNVGRSAYTDRIKQILLECKNNNVAQPIIDDLQNYEYENCHDELNWIDVKVHACKILNSKGKYVFITTTETLTNPKYVEEILTGGYNVITVTEDVRQKLSETKDILGNNIVDLEEFTEQWNNSFEYEFINFNKLNFAEKNIFNKRYEILKKANLYTAKIKDIKISETIKSLSSNCDGIWDAESGTIIINRSTLKSLEHFAGTLIHEAIHAKTNTSDLTINFEIELTKQLGRLVSQIINKNWFSFF